MEKVFTVNGRRVAIRPPVPSDAAGLLDVVRGITQEGTYFVVETHELHPEEKQRERLAGLDPRRQGWFVAEVDGVIAGHIKAERGVYARVQHTASFGLGLAPAYRGMGIGTKMIETVEEWARSVGVRKLYLGVFAVNPAARRLYERLGYEVEGVQKRQMLIKGEYVDDILMGKWLG